ncbi:MAG: hypothetical protein AAFP16_01280 [Pseudomonadota bacterium]
MSRRSCAVLLTCLAPVLLAAQFLGPARAQGQWYASGILGTMTEGSWYELVKPDDLRFADSHMIGAAIGWDRAIGTSRFRFGTEAQLLAHFGRQDHFELSVPVTLRYVPRRNRRIRSVTAGIGLSYASKIPQVEIDRNGASQRLFVHWLAEMEFGRPDPDASLFFRMHHRSDGYGVFKVDAGSTGYLFGYRRRY